MNRIIYERLCLRPSAPITYKESPPPPMSFLPTKLARRAPQRPYPRRSCTPTKGAAGVGTVAGWEKLSGRLMRKKEAGKGRRRGYWGNVQGGDIDPSTNALQRVLILQNNSEINRSDQKEWEDESVDRFLHFLFLSFPRGLKCCRGARGESDSFFFFFFLWSYRLLPPVEDFLMSQLDVSSRVLGGIESRERITGGEREKLLNHVYPVSVDWDATTQLSQLQKTASRLYPRRPGPDSSWFFL